MDFSVTTKLEKAWYVDPDLLAGETGDLGACGLDPDGARRPNETVTLVETDLVEAPDLTVAEDGVRRYRDVALKGALLVHEGDTSSLSPFGGAPRAAWLTSRLDRATRRLAAVVELIERGRISPIRLAVLAFCAGVVATLLGVAIAL
jgi:hypothetical protein